MPLVSAIETDASWCIEVEENSPLHNAQQKLLRQQQLAAAAANASPDPAVPVTCTTSHDTLQNMEGDSLLGDVHDNEPISPLTPDSVTRIRTPGETSLASGAGFTPQNVPLRSTSSLRVPNGKNRRVSLATAAFHQAQTNASFMRRERVEGERYADNNVELDYYCDGDGKTEFSGGFKLFKITDFRKAMGGGGAGEPIPLTGMLSTDSTVLTSARRRDAEDSKERLLQLGRSSILEQAEMRQSARERLRRVENDAYIANIIREPGVTPLPKMRKKPGRARRVAELAQQSREGVTVMTPQLHVGGPMSAVASRGAAVAQQAPGPLKHEGGFGLRKAVPGTAAAAGGDPAGGLPFLAGNAATALPHRSRRTLWEKKTRGISAGTSPDRYRASTRLPQPRYAALGNTETMVLTGPVDYKKLLAQQEQLRQDFAARDSSYERMLDSYHAIQNQVQRRLSYFIKN